MPAMKSIFAYWSMWMNADGDLVLLAHFVEAVEAVRVGVGTKGRDAQLLAEVEELFVLFVTFIKTLHAKRDGLDAIIAALLEHGFDFSRLRFRRKVFFVE